jgi:GGDEF domain-containing protein
MVARSLSYYCPIPRSEGAYELAQEVRQAIDNLAIPHKSSKAAKHVSVSIGLSALMPNAQNSITTLIDNADEGVYAAKKAGKASDSYLSNARRAFIKKRSRKIRGFVDGLRQCRFVFSKNRNAGYN